MLFRSYPLPSLPTALAGLCLLVAPGCLPEDTRPIPATVRTALATNSAVDDDPTDGITFTTADDYEVHIERIRMSFGRVKLHGDECNLYARGQGLYSRVVDPLLPEDQPIALTYALGQCKPHFRLYPPEDWAHIENPGISEADLIELRTEEFPEAEASFGRESTDDFVGPRGPRGAVLIVSGTARSLSGNAPDTEFRLAFGVPSSNPRCAPPGQEEFELVGQQELTLTVEMLPEQLFGTCESDELRFAPLARAAATLPDGEALSLDALTDVQLGELSEEEAAFYSCNRPALWGVELPEGFENIPDDVNTSPPTLRDWLNQRVQFDLFDVREAECVQQPYQFEEPI